MTAKKPVRPKQDEPISVPATSDMDLETFCKHFTKRHRNSLAGIKALDPKRLPFDIEQQYRVFHRRLHEIHPVSAYDHRHLEEPPEAAIEYALWCLEENNLTGWRQIAGARGVVEMLPGGEYRTRVHGTTTRHKDAESAAAVLVRKAS